MLYLFHRIGELLDGRPLVLDVDEVWRPLEDVGFQEIAQNGLKTYRKLNAFFVFGTQSPADTLRSPIAHSIIEQMATKIILPNSHGTPDNIKNGLEHGRETFRASTCHKG